MEPSEFALNTISSNSETVDNLPRVVIGIVMSKFVIGCCPNIPAADSRFWSFNASCKSFTVNPKLANLSGWTQIFIP